MRDKGCTRDRQQCCVKIKELRQPYRKTREVNSRSGSAPQTCCFYEVLHAILSGDPTTTLKGSVDTSQEPRATSGNNKEDIVDEEEENVRQANGGSILPDSEELFLTFEHIPSQDQLAVKRDTREGTSTEILSIGASSTPEQRLSQMRRHKKKTWEDMFDELMHISKSDKMELRAWRITLSENLDVDREDESMLGTSACHTGEMLRIMKEQSDTLRRLVEVQERQLDARVPLQPMLNLLPSSPSLYPPPANVI
nr:uncharacterized protein LOC112059403 [Chrysemys picta bellii]